MSRWTPTRKPQLARTTKTQTGLTVTAYLDRRNYLCGLKPTLQQVASLRRQRHDVLPEWNYTIKPQIVKLFLRWA